ncbi:uncharacterized protein LOC110979527 [Acanthaster planci]|uniref:Uncharacterized protein LOC110979527 n=1 Tax=Acanthaster planci TaxID=133434 RepID=A0A8B7YCV4_ACAPL|nr:uncharacterized protein LOC110979527 [Acanthaster planci]
MVKKIKREDSNQPTIRVEHDREFASTQQQGPRPPRQQQRQQQQQQYEVQRQQPVMQQHQLYRANGLSPQPQLYPAARSSPDHGTVILGPVVPTSPARRYRAKTAKTLGSLQIVICIVSAVLGVVAAAINTWGALVGLPIWAGICFYLPAGILGVLSTKPTNMQNCVINSCLVMSVFSAVVAGCSATVAGIAAANEYHHDGYSSYWVVGNGIIDILVCITALGEMVVAITQSTYCCRHRCACCQSPPSRQPNQTVRFETPVRYVTGNNPTVQLAMPYQQHQQQPPGYHVEGIVPLQNAPRNVQPHHPNTVGDYLATQRVDTTIELPAYTDSPPPSYTLSTGHM